MRIQIREAEASTAEQPLWVWRVWQNGRLTQGFCKSEADAKREADLAEHHDPSRRH